MKLISAFLLSIVVAWVMWRWLKKSEDEPERLISKWIISAVVLGITYYMVRGGANNQADAFILPISGAVCGVLLAVIWGQNIGSAVARVLGDIFTGGDTPPDPEAFYSIAEAKRKRGNYDEAIREIQKQLARFPRDLTGQMLLAEIQAEHLHDLPAAQLTIEHFCQQPGHAPKNIANALGRLADWHLKLSQDIEAARQTLQKITELLPDSEEALMAAQRIAHLGGTAELLAARECPTIHLKPGMQNLGLLKNPSLLKAPEEDPAAQAAGYVLHLEQHPLDNEAREQLALLYAHFYQRLDMASDQLEQLIQQPNQPTKQVVHWLHTLADLQVKHGGDYELVCQTLQRIIDLDSSVAAAEVARQRLKHLKLEFRGQEKIKVVKLGTYEQNIGLKRRPPHQSVGPQ